MHTFTVYILKCSDGSYYTGYTARHIDERIAEHQQGVYPTSYTYPRRPVELVWIAEFDDKEIAKEKELQLKGWSRKKKEAVINGDFDALPELAKAYSRK